MNKFGLTLCRFCPNKKHTLFDCPRLHFTPFRNTIPALYYRTEPMQKQQRQFAERNKEKSHFEFIVQNREPD